MKANRAMSQLTISALGVATCATSARTPAALDVRLYAGLTSTRSVGNLYHLNAEEEPENPDYPKDPNFRRLETRVSV